MTRGLDARKAKEAECECVRKEVINTDMGCLRVDARV